MWYFMKKIQSKSQFSFYQKNEYFIINLVWKIEELAKWKEIIFTQWHKDYLKLFWNNGAKIKTKDDLFFLWKLLLGTVKSW